MSRVAMFAWGVIAGALAFWLVQDVWREWRKEVGARGKFTETTERAAYTKLNEKSFESHPDMQELDRKDRDWYA